MSDPEFHVQDHPTRQQLVEEVRDQVLRSLGSGDGPNGGSMEPRVAKLEAAVEHMQSDIGDIKSDLREMRRTAERDFRIVFGAIIAATLGLAGLMAKGFGWL